MLTPDHILKIADEIEWLEDHLTWANWQYWDNWPEWIPVEMRDWYDNPGLTINRLDIRIRQKKQEYDRQLKLWKKLNN